MAKHHLNRKNENPENIDDLAEQKKDVLKLIKKLAKQFTGNECSQETLWR